MPSAGSLKSVARKGPKREAVKGQKRFLEKDGLIVIDAPDFARADSAGSGAWKVIDNLGHWKGAVTLFPQTGASYEAGKGPEHRI